MGRESIYNLLHNSWRTLVRPRNVVTSKNLLVSGELMNLLEPRGALLPVHEKEPSYFARAKGGLQYHLYAALCDCLRYIKTMYFNIGMM